MKKINRLLILSAFFVPVMLHAHAQGGHKLTIAFSHMDPHIGESLYFSLKNKSSGLEIERKMLKEIAANFDVDFDGILPDSSYFVDFFADHNSDGRYEFNVDHSWRIIVDDVLGDTEVSFVHNTGFTDIAWKYKLTVNFTGMTPHLNQVMKLYLRNHNTDLFVDSLKVDPLQQADFRVNLFSILPDSSYHVDFFVDFNENGVYDLPPVDHAWRIHLLRLKGDTIVNFAYNTNFTDIELAVISRIDNLKESGFIIYPNPVRDELIIRKEKNEQNISRVRILNTAGDLIADQNPMSAGQEIRVNVSTLKPGPYILGISDGADSKLVKFLKQ